MVLLSGVAAVAPVPRPHDIGVDVIATLLRPLDGRRLLAEESFYVQLKTEALHDNIVRYAGDGAAWLKALGLPLFIGLVNVAAARIRLFSTHIAMRCMLEADYDAFDLHLDPLSTRLTSPHPTTRATVLGPPVLEWTLSNLADHAWCSGTFNILKAWVTVEALNLRCRTLRWFRPLHWETNQPPEDAGTMMMGNAGRDDLTPVLQAMLPHVDALCREALKTPVDHELGAALLLLLETMKKRGVDADPDGIHKLLWLQALAGKPVAGVSRSDAPPRNARATGPATISNGGPTTGSSGPAEAGRSA